MIQVTPSNKPDYLYVQGVAVLYLHLHRPFVGK
jgi:hypothetical protein